MGVYHYLSRPSTNGNIAHQSYAIISHCYRPLFIYTNKPLAVSNVQVGSLSVSDHYPVSCTWLSKLPRLKKQGHTCITYRSF